MSEFNQVTIIKEANVYFDGKVNSRTVRFQDGSEKTLGFMQPGEYTFNTGAPELMEIYSGDLEIKLPNNDQWQTVQGGESFEVPGNAQFSLKIHTATDYCCSYIS